MKEDEVHKSIRSHVMKLKDDFEKLEKIKVEKNRGKMPQDIIREIMAKEQKRKRFNTFLKITRYVFLFVLGVGLSLLIYK